MIDGARFGHVNVTTDDWRSLADFYSRVFGCELVPPERDYSGPDLAAATALEEPHLTGAHLRLPGHGPDGPTIEIYSYDRMAPAAASGSVVNRAGWGHVAFQVPDVPAAVAAVIAGGGSTVGDVVTLRTADGRRVTWCYATDPDGNIVELQAWST
jgi:catechol 2,3-dioxygenase-like lactoylglutathione lyase family enzyme